jgi:CheY-like chemotaxis protein
MKEDKKDVLILDEQSESLLDLFDLVSGEGFDTTGVSTEREALSWMARNQPEVLLDHHGPSSRGAILFLERARALSPKTRIIRLAAPEGPDLGSNAGIGPGETGWIRVPFRNSEVLRALSQAVGGARAPEPEGPRGASRPAR